MSCNYAEGLSEYENKGVLGTPEVFDSEKELNEKCDRLVELIQDAKYIVFHTGAGISTAAGIPDFRGPNGVWTLEKKGLKPDVNVSFNEARPTKTHMALKALIDAGYCKFIVSQNIDGLHLKSGIDRKYISELHGNMFIEECNKCRRQFIRNEPATTVGQKKLGGMCRGGVHARPCRGGYLQDNILDWESDLPDKDLDLALMHSTLADLNICLGTTLQIVPSGNLPLKNKKFGGKLVICNLQPTKHNKSADLVLYSYVDEVLSKVLKKLGIEMPDYLPDTDPTKQKFCEAEWTILSEMTKPVEQSYSEKLKEYNKIRKSQMMNLPDQEVVKKIKIK